MNAGKIFKTLMMAMVAFGSINSFADCLPQYDSRIMELKSKRLVFTPEHGSNLLGSIGQSLGATAIGVTAGGVAGFILPYAITGVTYAAVGASGVIASAPATLIGSGTLVTTGACLRKKYKNYPRASQHERAGILLGAGMISVVPFGTLDVLLKGWSAWAPLMEAGGAVGTSLTSMTMSYFVPISALIGGATGLTIGARDAILNYKIKQFYKTKELITSAKAFLADPAKKIIFYQAYKTMGKRITRSVDLTTAAQTIAGLNETNTLCENELSNFRDLKKLIKLSAEADAATTVSQKNIETEDVTQIAEQVKEQNLVSKGYDENQLVLTTEI